jgi:hypothetical protein
MLARNLDREFFIVAREVQRFLYPSKIYSRTSIPTKNISKALTVRTDAEIEAALIHLDRTGVLSFTKGDANVGLTPAGAALPSPNYFSPS